MTISPRAALISAGLLLSLPALATDWDWTQEISNREWRESSLTWAKNTHPDSPSPLLLLATTAPPPREMWCTDNSVPTQADCDTFDDLLEDWTRDFLNIPAPASPPLAAMANFPEECSSICN